MGQSVPQTTWQFCFPRPAIPQGAALRLEPGWGGSASTAGAQLLSQTVWIDLGQGLTVQPRAGGRQAPAEVQIEAVSRQPGAGGLLTVPSGYSPEGAVQRREIMSHPAGSDGAMGCPLRTVRSKARNARGVLSTADLDGQDAAQLEIRLTLPLTFQRPSQDVSPFDHFNDMTRALMANVQRTVSAAQHAVGEQARRPTAPAWGPWRRTGQCARVEDFLIPGPVGLMRARLWAPWRVSCTPTCCQ